ncbi:MAG TPA: hypothetical protein VGE98_14515 [Thermoanaerobaculia bacterium]
MKWRALCRWAATILAVSSLLVLLATPICASDSCPMSPSQRVACRTMGLDCCQAKGRAATQSAPQVPVLETALAPGSIQLLSAEDPGLVPSSSPLLDVSPAVLQGVGLFTLLAVFRL